MLWADSANYWTEQGLRLPTKAEAGVVYNHTSELSTILRANGYADDYFQNGDTFWTSSSSDTYINYKVILYMKSGEFGSTTTTNIRHNSFGVYVK